MTMSIKEKTESEEIEWSPEDEIQLFLALDGLKPVGINKYFFMACIADRLSKALNREVSTEAIWSHLKTLYNLDALDELEPLPFPNEQKEFSLPESEFSSLLSKKKADINDEQKKIDNKSDTFTSSSTAITNVSFSTVTSSALSSASSSATLTTTTTTTASATKSNKTSSATLSGQNQQSSATPPANANKSNQSQMKELLDKKIAAKIIQSETPKRTPKRTRGSMSLESNSSPSTTPPPTLNNKRRRI